MSDFQQSLQDYMNSRQSVAQQTLAENNELKQSRAQGIQAEGATLVGKTSVLFGDKIKEEASKIQDELGVDLSLGTVVPAALKLGSRLASMRASALNSKWKEVNAERFNQKENAANEAEPEAEDVAEDVSEDFPKQTLPTVRAGGLSSGEIKNPAFESDDMEEATSGLTEDEPTSLPPIRNMAEETLGEDDGMSTIQRSFANAKPFTRQTLAGERATSADSEPLFRQPATTSDRIGDAINEARQNKPQETPEEPEPEEPKAQEPEEPEIEEPEEPTISETSFMDRMPTEDEIGKAPSGLESQEAGLENEASDLATDLAPEITESASLASSIGEGLLSAIPVVGGILGVAGLITGSIGIADNIKAMSEDPYAGIKGKLSQYQQKIGGLENQVSADQFQEKLGASRPQFGSLAVPQMDTSKMTNVALHS